MSDAERASSQHPIAGAAVLAALNHLLQHQPDAQRRLARHAGKTVQLDILPMRLAFAIQDDGGVSRAEEDTPVDAQLDVPIAAVYRLATTDIPPAGLIRMAGDTALAAEIGEILRGLRWDAEEDLSRVFGDILAHRMVGAGTSLIEWQKKAGLSLFRSLAEYWTEEQPVLARPADVEAFIGQVDDVRNAAERLEKRAERLEQQLSARNERHLSR